MTDDTLALKKPLRQHGYAFLGSGRGDNEIWRNDETGRKVVVDAAIKSRHTANGHLEAGRLAQSLLIRHRSSGPMPRNGPAWMYRASSS